MKDQAQFKICGFVVHNLSLVFVWVCDTFNRNSTYANTCWFGSVSKFCMKFSWKTVSWNRRLNDFLSSFWTNCVCFPSALWTARPSSSICADPLSPSMRRLSPAAALQYFNSCFLSVSLITSCLAFGELISVVFLLRFWCVTCFSSCHWL